MVIDIYVPSDRQVTCLEPKDLTLLLLFELTQYANFADNSLQLY